MTVKHILIVDDEPTVLDFLRKVLTRNGFDCRTAVDAGQALAELNRSTADLVVTDIHMPGSDGAWLLNTIHKQWPEVPVIMLTGESEASVAVECIKAGAADYLLKPVEVPRLIAAVQSALQLDASDSEVSAANNPA